MSALRSSVSLMTSSVRSRAVCPRPPARRNRASLTAPIAARQPLHMTETELPITGYLDRFSHRPGESLHRACQRARRRRVSRAAGARAERRSQSGRPRPALRGFRRTASTGRSPGRRQPIRHGSCGIVDAGPVRDATSACTWTALVCPTRPDGGRVLLAEEGSDAGVTLLIGATRRDGTASLSPRQPSRSPTGTAMQMARWYRVWCARIRRPDGSSSDSSRSMARRRS